ncbi:MAG: signal transduction histidine kinase [Bacteroidota bacterium]|jgi:sensor histidine kinase YesM|nr:signal transduction histidine kinase [Bacteroidota bacterium]
MSKKNLYWICQIGGWLLFVLFNSVLIKLNGGFNVNVAKSLSILLVLGIIVSHQYRNVIIRLGWLKMNLVQLLPRVLVVTLGFAVVMEIFQFSIEWLIGIANWQFYNASNITYNVFQIALLLFFWSIIYFLIHYIENYKKAEIENLKWEASINEIELNKLKSQLNPHFMFNAMNSIRALVDENPLKSKDAITQLSNILRNTLQMGKNKVISFDEEMKIVNDYLALETIRYEERLRTSVNIQPESSSFHVPPLMIQTLVENGIKHGISKLTAGGILSIDTLVKDEKLFLFIRNSGQIRENKDTDSGFGIKNTLQRLQLLYGKSASLKISNENDNTVLTELIIPKEMIG